jgi:hypothetical protein
MGGTVTISSSILETKCKDLAARGWARLGRYLARDNDRSKGRILGKDAIPDGG